MMPPPPPAAAAAAGGAGGGVGGFKRSRLLWDKALRTHHETWSVALTSYLQAVLYELQPIRWSQLKVQLQELKRQSLHLRRYIESGRSGLMKALEWIKTLVCNLTVQQWMWLGGIGLYYGLVRWIHLSFELGPVVLMTTALVIIFTIGLGDDVNRDGLSAYAVFNRGFQRLLGSVNEEELLAQHVGGGAGAFMMMGQRGGGAGGGGEGQVQWDERDEEDDDDVAPRRQRERPPQQEQPPAAAAADDEARPQPRRRQTGKKARRRNLEQRQEMRRQREAARGMGFRPDNNIRIEDLDADAAAALLLGVHDNDAPNNDNHGMDDLEEEDALAIQQALLEEEEEEDQLFEQD